MRSSPAIEEGIFPNRGIDSSKEGGVLGEEEGTELRDVLVGGFECPIDGIATKRKIEHELGHLEERSGAPLVETIEENLDREQLALR